MKRVFKALPILMCAVLVMSIVASCGKDKDKNKSSSSDSSSVIEVIEQDQLDDDDSASGSKDKNDSGSDSKDKNSSDNQKDNKDNKDKNNTNNSAANGNNANNNTDEKGNAANNSSSDKTGGNKNSDNKNSDNKTTQKNNTDSKSSGNNQSQSNNNVKLTGKEKTFEITLYPNYAPITCENFEKLVNDGFYNGLTFNRVIDSFVAQAGKSEGIDTIKGEFKSNGVNNGLSHTRGTVSMARLPDDPNSASGQFFICYDDNCKFLDGQYAAFGKLTGGFDVVDGFLTIKRTTGSDGTLSKPVTPITIKLAKMDGKDSKGNPRVKFYVEY